jgi:hypothetical protein
MTIPLPIIYHTNPLQKHKHNQATLERVGMRNDGQLYLVRLIRRRLVPENPVQIYSLLNAELDMLGCDIARITTVYIQTIRNAKLEQGDRDSSLRKDPISNSFPVVDTHREI